MNCSTLWSWGNRLSKIEYVEIYLKDIRSIIVLALDIVSKINIKTK